MILATMMLFRFVCLCARMRKREGGRQGEREGETGREKIWLYFYFYFFPRMVLLYTVYCKTFCASEE